MFAASREGHLIALDETNGAFLWRFQTGTAIEASPISYAVGGKQFIAVSSGPRVTGGCCALSPQALVSLGLR